MRCYDLFKLKTCNNIELCAGIDGLNREIEWIYYAESVPLGDCPKYLSGNELIIILGTHMNHNFEELYSVLPNLYEKNIAGILLNTGEFIQEIPQGLIEQANDLKIPVFTIPWESRMVDVTKDICNAILLSPDNTNHYTSIFNELLFSKNLTNWEVARLTRCVDFAFDKEYRVMAISSNFHSLSNTARISDRDFLNELITYRNLICIIIDNLFSGWGIKKILLLHEDYFVLMVENVFFSNKGFEKKMDWLYDEIHRNYPDADIHIGISNIVKTPYNYHNGYKEAKTAMRISAVSQHKDKPSFYEDISLWTLLLEIKSNQVLENFYNSFFAKIIEYDQSNDTKLIETLIAYLQNQMSIQNTASALYLHKNSLQYRLNKIESLLGISLRDPEDIANVIIAMKIKELLNL